MGSNLQPTVFLMNFDQFSVHFCLFDADVNSGRHNANLFNRFAEVRIVSMVLISPLLQLKQQHLVSAGGQNQRARTAPIAADIPRNALNWHNEKALTRKFEIGSSHEKS